MRPLAADEAAFRALLAAREPLYREVATQVADVAARPADAVAADLAAGLTGAAGAAPGAGRRRRPVRRLTVQAASRTYPILVGRDVLEELGAAVRRLRGDGQIVVLCDENVAPLYLERARRSLVAAGLSASQVILPAGEREKSLARAEELYGVLYDRGLRRSDTLVALGGGVIGDLTGFVAATYQRGIGFVQVPTTLLAQVDASVGGKVAVDFRAGKNYVGTFYQPSLVLADLRTLETLPARELRCGAAEVAKHGLLAGSAVLRRVRQLARAPLAAGAVTQELVAGSIPYKAGVVERDERESGLRAVLNFGHTIGHAIEAATGFRRFSHGEAVASRPARGAAALRASWPGCPRRRSARRTSCSTGWDCRRASPACARRTSASSSAATRRPGRTACSTCSCAVPGSPSSACASRRSSNWRSWNGCESAEDALAPARGEPGHARAPRPGRVRQHDADGAGGVRGPARGGARVHRAQLPDQPRGRVRREAAPARAGRRRRGDHQPRRLDALQLRAARRARAGRGAGRRGAPLGHRGP